MNQISLCVVGTGAAGLIACNFLKSNYHIKNIFLVGTDEIPSIGVGESNTLKLTDIHHRMGIDHSEFVVKSDAAVKYGVLYKNWGKNDFLHFFKGSEPWGTLAITAEEYGKLLANKNINTPLHSIFGEKIYSFTQKNLVSLDSYEYPVSWHFDASLYINFLKQNALKDNKIKFINDKVIGCTFNSNQKIKNIKLKSGIELDADYFIFASGASDLIDGILGEEYFDISNILLTDRAVIYPLEYTDKKTQFHPYTVAKTMKCGWRWITPTYSRIGTGYVYSSKYISDESAVEEFINDIGDKNISPRIVKFNPRYNKKTYKNNYCSLGMSNGFLEPLDAPGITLSIDVLYQLEKIISSIGNNYSEEIYSGLLDISNQNIEKLYKYWTSFILCQYKTCYRNDTNFWIDHKKVYYEHYENIVSNLDYFNTMDNMMFYHTMSGKDHVWKSNFVEKPFKIFENDYDKMNHLDFVDKIRNEYSQKTNKLLI